MKEILKNVEETASSLDYVSVDSLRIRSFTSGITEKELRTAEITPSFHHWNKEQMLSLIFIFNAVNFCYWAENGQEKWTIEVNGEKIDGAMALFRAFEEELAKNPKFIGGDCLKNLGREDLSRILKGNVEIPMLTERLELLSEAGRVLSEKYNGSFINLSNASGHDAVKLADLIINDFPGFSDVQEYKGREVPFYKRVQLDSKMINDALTSYGEEPLANLDKLSAFADYKLPQILRSLGIIKYAEELSSKINSYELIDKNSPYEVEIRIATVLAVEQIKQHLAKKYPWVTGAHVDSMLWNKSQDKSLKVDPYHRTYTTAY